MTNHGLESLLPKSGTTTTKKAAAGNKEAAAKAKAPIGSSSEGRCMKCKEQVAFEVTGHDRWSNGMVVALGKCSACNTKVQRILGKA